MCTLQLRTLVRVPELKSKAHNQAVISMWLCQMFESQKDFNEEFSMVYLSLCGFCELFALGRESKKELTIFMNQDKLKRLQVARGHALHGYNFLWTLALRDNLPRWPSRPKLHQADHLCRRSLSTGICYSTWWSFSNEDWMGVVAKLRASCHASSISTAALNRWLLGFCSSVL